MNIIIRFSSIAALLACAACSVTTAPAPQPQIVVQQPAVTTVPAGSTVIVPRPAY